VRDVSGFLLRQRGLRRKTVAAMRSCLVDFLAFLVTEGLTARSLADRLPPQRHVRHESEPHLWTSDEIRRVLAVIDYEDLDTFLEAALRDSKLADQQALDIWGRVLGHLQVMVGDAPVNPREVKRYVNEYTLLMAANPALDPDVVLCLSTL
jgi:hypothetical protein